MLRSHMPVITSAGSPAWLQVVHGEHVSNRVRGRLTDPSVHLASFPRLIDRLPRPRVGAVAVDLFVAAPLRRLRDGVRGSAKRVLLAVGGKQAPDRVKLLLRRRRSSHPVP
jgi:hypothetical protein